MISMVPPGNDGTTGVCWGKLKINWNNGSHPYQAGTNMVTSEVDKVSREFVLRSQLEM